ncbi:MAG: MutS family DNA mismatch repair protein [Chloroflexota bacterium]|nr:MutS family DNA mismatch repair protein [Chloroflexota bacterium]
MQEKRLLALQNQIVRLQNRLTVLRQQGNRYSWLRVLTFLIGIAASASVLFLTNIWLFAATLALSILLFGTIVYRHRQIEQTIARFTIWQQIKTAQIARIQLDWAGLPAALPIDPDPDHPFAADLDLGGDSSLHHLVDTAVSVAGSQRLYAWLTAPVPNAQTIGQRQRLVHELSPLALFRDKLTLNARLSNSQSGRWNTQPLQSWLQTGAAPAALRLWLVGLSLLAVVNGALWGMNQAGWIAPIWQITFLIYVGLQFATVRLTGETFHTATELRDAVEPLVAIFRQLETFSYRQTPDLQTLCAPLLDPTHRPSRTLRRIQWVVAATGIQGNPLIALLLNAILPWNFFFAYLLQRYKHEAAQHAPAWLEVWFELEALGSLANLAYLNPDYTFPTLQVSPAPVSFSTKQLGHPLLPAAAKVCNDFTIDHLGELALLTGSNMAGKSTFLRALGMNLALAYAGGVVNAQTLETDLFRLFTCIKISDSVTKGVSYFYAEVKRLKTLLDELERSDALPLFFCIDEIFRGTNNRERLIGSRAYIRQLVDKHGVGLISTHDLELVKLADELPAITNYHFRDEIVDGAMTFDYRLHPGPCPTTNALKVMRNAGLPVPV